MAIKTIAVCLTASSMAVATATAWPQAADNFIPSFKQLDSIEARVQGCVTCHGRQGQGGADKYPRIAGKPSRYLYNQLTYFRTGSRHYVPMNYLVAYLPESYLREMADYFSASHPPLTAPGHSGADAATLARGKALATAGDAQKDVPKCIACHGERLTGMEPGIPGLAGLTQTYIAAQLTRWRVGERRALDPDCMQRIASRLSDSDVRAVSSWLAEQPLPADQSPEPSNLVRLPLACGSQR